MSQEEKQGFLNKLKKPFRSHSRSSSMNSDKGTGSTGTASSNGNKRASAGSTGVSSRGTASVVELSYQEGRKRAELERKGGADSGTYTGTGTAGAGSTAGASSSKSYRSGDSYDNDTVVSSPMGRVVRHPPKVHRTLVDKDTGGDFANEKLPIDDSLVNKEHYGSGAGARTGTGARSEATTTAGAAGRGGRENGNNSGVIENDYPLYADDANKKEGTGVFFDPRDTQGGVYGKDNGGEMSEATKAELEKQRDLKTHPSAYYEQQEQQVQQKQETSVIDEIKNSAYNEGQAQGSRDTKASQKSESAQESEQESPSKYGDPEKEHAKNKSAWNREGVSTAAAGATPTSLYSERGSGAGVAGAAVGGAGAAGIAAGSNRKTDADDARGTASAYESESTGARGTNNTYGTSSGVGATAVTKDLSEDDYEYDRQIKELDKRIASTQKEIDQVNSADMYGSSAGNSGVSKSTPSTTSGTGRPGTSGTIQTRPAAAAGVTSDTKSASSADQGDSSDKTGILAGTGIAAAIAGAVGYGGLSKSNDNSTVGKDYVEGVKSASASTGSSKFIIDEVYKQGVISGSYDAGKEYFKEESIQTQGTSATSGTAPGTGTYKDKNVASTDIYNKEATGGNDSSDDESSNKTGILAGSGIAAAIAGAAGYVGLGGKSHEKTTVDEAYKEGVRAASEETPINTGSGTAGTVGTSNVDETKAEAFVKDPKVGLDNSNISSQANTARVTNARTGAATGGVLGVATTMASNTLGFDTDEETDSIANDSTDASTNDRSATDRNVETNDDGTSKPGVLGGVAGAISAAGAVAAEKIGYDGSHSDIINEAYEAGRKQGIVDEAYETGRQKATTELGTGRGSSSSSKTSRSIDTPRLQDVDDDEEEDEEEAYDHNTTVNSTRSGLFGVFGGAAAAIGLSTPERIDSNKSGVDPTKVDSEKDTVPREDLANADPDNSSGSGILGAFGFNRSNPTSSSKNLVDAAEDDTGDVVSQPRHQGNSDTLENAGRGASSADKGAQKVTNLGSSNAPGGARTTGRTGSDKSPNANVVDSSRKETVPNKDLAKEDTDDSKSNDNKGLGIGAAVGAAAGALGYGGSKIAANHTEGSLIDPAARNFDDVAEAPAHVGGEEHKNSKQPEADVTKSEDEPKASQNLSQTEADVAAFNKKHGHTDDDRNLIEIAEDTSPEIKNLESHQGASIENEARETSEGSGDNVQPVPGSVSKNQDRHIATGGKDELNESSGSYAHTIQSEDDAKKKSSTNELDEQNVGSDKHKHHGLMGAVAGAAGAMGLSSTSDKNRSSHSKDTDPCVGADAAYGTNHNSSNKQVGTSLSEKELHEYYVAGINRGSYEAGQIAGAEDASLATTKKEKEENNVDTSGVSDTSDMPGGYKEADTREFATDVASDSDRHPSNSHYGGAVAAGAAGAGAFGAAAGYGLSSSNKDTRKVDASEAAYGSQSNKNPLQGFYNQGANEGSYSKGIEEGAYSHGVQQAAYESGNTQAAKNVSSGKPSGTATGAGTGAGTAYGKNHVSTGKQTGATSLNEHELYTFYVAGIIQGSYEAGEIAGAEDASLASDKSQTDKSSHGYGAAAAGAIGAGVIGAGVGDLASSSKNKSIDESNLLVEVIGVKDENAASKIAHQASKELSAQGVDLTHGKLVINTQTKEVYKTDDVAEKVGSPGSQSSKNAVAGSTAGGVTGGVTGGDVGYATANKQSGVSPKGNQRGFDSTNPNDHHDEHQKAKERLSAAASAGVLGNTQPSSGLGKSTKSEREFDSSAGQSQSHHGLKAGATGAGIGAAAAAAAASYGSHSHPQNKAGNANKDHNGGIRRPTDATVDGHSTASRDMSSREAMGHGAVGQGAAGHGSTDHTGTNASSSKPSDGSDIVVTVQGTKDNTDATRIATQTVEALKKQPTVLAAVKELRIDATTGIVTNEHGQRIDLTPSNARGHQTTQDPSGSKDIGVGSRHNQQSYQDTQTSRLDDSSGLQGYDAYNQTSRDTDSAAAGLGAAGAAGAYDAHRYGHNDAQDSRLGGSNGQVFEEAYKQGYNQGSQRQTEGSRGYGSANVVDRSTSRGNDPDQVAPTSNATTTQPETTGIRMPGSFF